MTISLKDIYKYTGDISQVFGVKQYIFSEGRSRGMRGVDVNNGSGLMFTLLPDRAMDISLLSYKGVNFSYITKAGHVAPEYYDDKGLGWLKTFTAGFLTTCGLTQAGSPCESDGESLGQHGDISTVPAEEFCVETDLDAVVPEIRISGRLRTGRIFGDNIWIKREMLVRYGENKIYINDTVENRSGKKRPYMVLYHFNLGYPLLDEHSEFVTNAEYIRPRDSEAVKGENWRVGFQKPENGFKEQVFYYDSKAESGKTCYAGIHNKKLNMGVNIHVKPEQLPKIIQWKTAAYGDYAQGIEPANCYPEGREMQKKYGLEYIGPFETKTQEIYIEIV